jgi:hypothetical protein
MNRKGFQWHVDIYMQFITKELVQCKANRVTGRVDP